MNEFTIEGTVQDIQWRESAKGRKYSVIQILADREVVPLAQFGRIKSEIGDQVRVTGKLGSSPAGFFQAASCEWETLQPGAFDADPGPVPDSVADGDLPF